jgi:hypothetical protein
VLTYGIGFGDLTYQSEIFGSLTTLVRMLTEVIGDKDSKNIRYLVVKALDNDGVFEYVSEGRKLEVFLQKKQVNIETRLHTK